MKKTPFKLLAIFCVMLLLAACGGGGSKKVETRAAKGGLKYGGVFRYNETEFLKSLYPLGITEVVGHRIVTQVYEGLVMFNTKDLTIEPQLAESWTVDSSATIYTFKLRKGVKFHDDDCFAGGKGREVKAQDFVYCLNLLCTEDTKNQGFDHYRDIIKGATQHYDSTKARAANIPPVSGIKAIDDYTLEIVLEKSYADFLNRIALPFASVFPKEAVEKYKGNILYHTVGTGPFVLKNLKQDDAVILARNEAYWGVDEHGNQLPYMDGIKVSFIKEDKTEMSEFKKGNFEVKYRLPFDMIDEILDANKQLKGEYAKFQFQNIPEYAIQFYGFQLKDEVFKNKNLRLAFNYAIDRASIVDFTAKGEGTPAFSGFVPLGMLGYDNSKVKGYEYNVAKAKEYLAKAGYPNGKGLGKVTLEINSGGGRNEKVAEAIQRMLQENLNIEVAISQVVWAQHTNNVETAKTNFWRFGWVADYPDPNNFFQLFYGKNVPDSLSKQSYGNPTRYQNKTYDEIYVKALATPNAEERNALYNKLDQMIVDDAPVMLIYYSVNRRLLQPYLRNFNNNSMEYRNLREVWFDK